MKRAAVWVAGGLALCVIASVLFAIAFALGAGVWLQGATLALAFAGLALALCVWSVRVLPRERVTEKREAFDADIEERREAEREAETGLAKIGRIAYLERLLLAALGTLGVALLFPLRSLAPRSNVGPDQTKWRPGARLVTEGGLPIRNGDLAFDSMITVFPEGAVGDANSATILLRPRSGYVAFSKICTHAGCPVGLYRAAANQLLCPCHQSVFDVTRGARPVFGPAPRPLPQLPLFVSADGYLRARSGFSEPVGPSYWERS